MQTTGFAGSGLLQDRPVVFISYSHVDAEWMIRLERHLRPLQSRQLIKLAIDTDIQLGEEWKPYLQAGIDQCQAAVLLLSVDFFNSVFIMKEEYPRLLERALENKLLLIPVYVGPIGDATLPETLKRLQGTEPRDFLLKIALHEAESIFARISNRIHEHFGREMALQAIVGGEGLKVGRDAYKFCNRRTLRWKFEAYLKNHLEEGSRRPMMVFIPGMKCEEHRNFADVLMEILRDHLLRMPEPERRSMPSLKHVSWPTESGFGELKNCLLMSLAQIMGSGTHLASGLDLCGLRTLRSQFLVVYVHNLYAKDWSNAQSSLLEWYLDEFWAGLDGSPEDAPRCMVLFNVIYDEIPWPKRAMAKLLSGSKGGLRRTLEGIVKFHRPNVSCLVLPELEPVSENHVREWFDEYGHSEFVRNNKDSVVGELFRDSENRCMNEVAKALKSVCLPLQ